MRTAQEFIDRQRDMLTRALQRPTFFCGDEGDMYFGAVLRDLCWLEGREDKFDELVCDLLRGSRRVYGQLDFQDLAIRKPYSNEIASTYAEAAFRLGNYTPTRLLPPAEFDQLSDSLSVDFFQCDHTETEMTARFGMPSHDAIGGQTTVHCYGCVDSTRKWICFDYSRCYPPPDRITHQYFDDPILRSVRRDENIFELLPFAGWCDTRDEGTEENFED